ncbi:MAG: histone deacetylase [Candidatus Omnitrophica bacterium]|nr:histone deacetylase [Candidatus Omnitrophota bacterium]
MKIVYSDRYNVDIGDHVFPTEKYALTRQLLTRAHHISSDCFIRPQSASDKDILRIHAPEYIHKLKQGSLTLQEIARLEVPYSTDLMEAAWLCAGGTLISCRYALDDGISAHIGGGFHHAFPDHGEGFCVLNDVAIALAALLDESAISRPVVIDCDVHQGNGTAFIFQGNPDVFTFSIHQRDNYPFAKIPSDLDVELDDGTGDREYIRHLHRALDIITTAHQPDFALYIAGADPFYGDVLGGLALSLEGLEERDVSVFAYCRKHKIPCAVVLGGGYAASVETTAQIHCNTIKTACEASGGKPQ